MSGKQLAETIIITIQTLIKRTLFLCLKALIVICVLGGIITLGYFIFNWYTIERHKNKVEIIVKFDNDICSNKTYPLFVLIKNNSSRRIEHTNIYIKIHKHEYSTPLNDPSKSLDSDKIIESHSKDESCWSIKNKNLINKTDLDLPHFYCTRTLSNAENKDLYQYKVPSEFECVRIRPKSSGFEGLTRKPIYLDGIDMDVTLKGFDLHFSDKN